MKALVAALLAVVGLAAPLRAADPNLPGTNAPGWTYTVLPGAIFLDDCPPCGRPSVFEPVSGTFRLRLLDANPLDTTLAVEEVDLVALRPDGSRRHLRGSGTFAFGGEVAVRQRWELHLDVDDGPGTTAAVFTNDVPTPERAFPMMAPTLSQANGTFTKVFHLDLPAAPFAALWFSTRHGMTPANLPKGANPVVDGDLLSASGRVVRRYPELLAPFGFMPPVADLGLDAVDVLPGGQVAFSVKADAFGEIAGPVHHGDALSERGFVLRSNHDLLAAFGVKPDAKDAGLDGLQSMPDGEVLFSTRDAFFAPALGGTVGGGDLLSNRGRVVKSNHDLLVRFPLALPVLDLGLCAFHVWPSGEVWFAVEQDFRLTDGRVVLAGDLLSDAGHVVCRNLDLVRAFSPLEDLADFGLDAVFPVSDWESVPGPLQFTRVAAVPEGLSVAWKGVGRAFQLLGAADPAGPWTPVKEVSPDTAAVLPWSDAPPRFLRVRQW